MIKNILKSIWESKVRSSLTILGVATCVLVVMTADGMMGNMRIELLEEVAQYENKLFVQAPGAGYPPLSSRIPQQEAMAILQRDGLKISESTPVLFAILEPADSPISMAGILAVGLLPGREQAYLGKTRAAVGVAELADLSKNGVIIGADVAHFYNVSSVGSQVVAQGKRWEVTGILQQSGVGNIDTAFVMNLKTAQGVFSSYSNRNIRFTKGK